MACRTIPTIAFPQVRTVMGDIIIDILSIHVLGIFTVSLSIIIFCLIDTITTPGYAH